VIRALAYCGYRHDERISLPSAGVNATPVRLVAAGELRLLWSEVEWPLAPANMQKNAVDFHTVVNHVFRQTAVAPFRLLSVFDEERALAAFAGQHEQSFLADLERLKDVVQMECVIYPTPFRVQGESGSGAEYLRKKAVLLRSAEGFAAGVREAVARLAREVRTRETKNGIRIFVLVERGREDEFRATANALALPEHLSRRTSGPWPAAEFLSEQVRAPQIAGVR
jgi:hypothetical protein